MKRKMTYAEVVAEMKLFHEVVDSIRSVRSQYRVLPGVRLDLYIMDGTERFVLMMDNHYDALCAMTGLNSILVRVVAK